jgi:hypothetical protein
MKHLYKIQPEETKAYRNYLDIEGWVEELNALDELEAINAELEDIDEQKEHDEIMGELWNLLDKDWLWPTSSNPRKKPNPMNN